MHSLSDAALAVLNSWLQWIGIGSLALALLSAVGLYFVNAETGRRQDAQLAERDQRIAALQPKPLKERVRSFLERLDSRAIAAIQGGQLQFVMMLTYAQAAELQALAHEDGAGDYISVLPNTNIMMNEPGKAGQFIFRLSRKVIE